MSLKRPKRGAADLGQGNGSVAALPNELFIEIWDYLPPMERISVSQVCVKWRRISLSTPGLWSRIAFFSSRHWERCSCSTCRAKGSNPSSFNIYWPASNANNSQFFEELLLRSADMPLDVTLLLGSICGEIQKSCFRLLIPHSRRLARIHFESGDGADLGQLARFCGSLPALRTVTAGFDDCAIEYCDLPQRLYPDTPFPVLNQVRVGAASSFYSGFFCGTQMPSVHELTLTPVHVYVIQRDLSMCPNLSRLSLALAQFPTGGNPHHVDLAVQTLADVVAHVPEVCLLDIPAALDGRILKYFNDARHRHLILDYQGRPRVAGSSWWLSLPGPCEALADSVRLTLRLREGVYELDVCDALNRHREVLLDASTIRMAPGLWNCYVRGKNVVSATVDALAWDYLKTGLPDACAIPDLTLVVARSPAELQDVSLAPISSMRKLRIDSLRSGMRLGSTVLRRLVAELEGGQLAVLSICANAHVDDLSVLAQLASSITME